VLSGGAGGVIKEWKWNQDFELKFSKEWCVAQRFVPATQRLSFEGRLSCQDRLRVGEKSERNRGTFCWKMDRDLNDVGSDGSPEIVALDIDPFDPNKFVAGSVRTLYRPNPHPRSLTPKRSLVYPEERRTAIGKRCVNVPNVRPCHAVV
jgi:hypothetical protein